MKEEQVLVKKSQGSNITNTHRLIFVESMVSDPSEVLYWSSQDFLTGSGLDSRDTTMKVIDFTIKSRKYVIIVILNPSHRRY